MFVSLNHLLSEAIHRLLKRMYYYYKFCALEQQSCDMDNTIFTNKTSFYCKRVIKLLNLAVKKVIFVLVFLAVVFVYSLLDQEDFKHFITKYPFFKLQFHTLKSMNLLSDFLIKS